jgi:CCR4-NOT transcription complex subunit 7/8
MNIFAGNAGLQGAFGTGAGLGNSSGGLASQAAQAGFAHGAALQQQHGHEAANANAFTSKGNNSRIREVWKHNLKQELAVLRQLVERYPYISMVSDLPASMV